MSLKIDSILQSRYRIINKFAQSGMGTIYLAHDEVLNVDVAVKENLYTTAAHSTQFRQEATILAKLRHPSLPRVIDHFVLEGIGEYLVMDYVEGEDLKEFLQGRDTPLEEQEVVRIGVVICDALAYLHSRTPPIIHRDIKPANLKITQNGDIHLVDFGLAKSFEQGEMTAIGAKGVTPGYSPVEQYGGGTDIRSDIYALGATLYTLLIGKVPSEAIERAMGNEDQESLDLTTLEISGSLQSVIKKAMALQADSRFQSAQAFREALLEAYPLPAFSQEKPQLSDGPLSSPSQWSTGVADPTIKAPKKKKRKVWLWLIPIFILIGGGIFMGIRFLDGLDFSSGNTVETPLNPGRLRS